MAAGEGGAAVIYGARHIGWVAGVALLACALVGGCHKGPLAKPQAADPGLEKRVERGPVKMVVRADRSKITIAEKLNLSIEVEAAGGVDVEMPSFGDKLNEFEIRDFRDRSAVPVNTGGQAACGTGSTGAGSGMNARRWTQEYVLESFLSGDLEVPAITAKFHDKRDSGQDKDGELASEPFKIQVTSLLAGQFDPKKFRDIKGTVELPVERGRAWLWWSLAVAGAVAALAIIIGLLRHRTRRAAVPKPLPAHEWAFFALQRLEEDRLIEAGRVQEFYFRLSGIVREYIERRFGLMAPERTTPEFLMEVRAAPSLGSEHKRLLGDFLQAADMVKFARYEPAQSEVNGALGTAREFVDQTTPRASENSSDNAPPSPGIQIPGIPDEKPQEVQA
jgi:hypothetical protein